MPDMSKLDERFSPDFIAKVTRTAAERQILAPLRERKKTGFVCHLHGAENLRRDQHTGETAPGNLEGLRWVFFKPCNVVNV
jgi:hypothetical protein